MPLRVTQRNHRVPFYKSKKACVVLGGCIMFGLASFNFVSLAKVMKSAGVAGDISHLSPLEYLLEDFKVPARDSEAGGVEEPSQAEVGITSSLRRGASGTSHQNSTTTTIATKAFSKDDYPYGIVPKSPYVYSFVVGSFHENQTAYKGFLYNVFNAVYSLRSMGSTADFVLWAQLSPNSTLQNELPAEDLQALKTLKVNIIQMEKPTYESFAHLMYDKFRVLQLTQYRRVIYLDSDVLPLVNLDYWFHLSDEKHTSTPTILRPNLIWASRGAPCNGGMFMLHPFEGSWKIMSDIIENQRKIGQQMPYPHFDWREGWGHNFRNAGDEWEAIERTGQQWRFHGGHSDQGLWYYYAKYIVQDVSITIRERLQSFVPWNSTMDGIPADATRKPTMPIKLKETKNELEGFAPKPTVVQPRRCEPKSADWMCHPPGQDVAHFMGSHKPWQEGRKGSSRANLQWYKVLRNVSDVLNLGLDIDNWEKTHMVSMKESPLGYMPWWKDNAKFILVNKTNATNAAASR